MIDVQITGVADAANKLGNSIDKNKIQNIMIKGGFEIEGEAKRTCRDLKAVDTGRLMGSISTNWNESGFSNGRVDTPAISEDGASQPEIKNDDIAVVRIGTNVNYAIYVHEGTRRMLPRPFLLIAVKAKLPKIQNEINDLFNKI